MSALRDPEQGLADGESRHPLLGTRLHDGGERLRPPRPTNLNITETSRHPERIQPQLRLNLSFQTHTPSTTTSTANNTPITDTGVEWPKKWRRSDRRLRRLNTELLEAIETHNIEETERLLNAGANPNATCRLSLVSACHMAALAGGDALSLLLKFGAEKLRLDSIGRTPLHLAAWAANARQMAMLLDVPEDIQLKIGDESLGSDLEDELKQINDKTRVIANVPCDLDLVKTDLPSTWKDNIDHNCRGIEGTLPVIQMGWTPLHVASACAKLHCTRLLLAAGADPNFKDCIDRTPLDVVGAAYYFDAEIEVKNFIEVISMLLNAGGTFNTMRNNVGYKIDTPLHVAVELECLEAINSILDAGASITCHNANGQTPLHLCVAKQLEIPLAVLANYAHLNADPFAAMVDVKDSDGHTVLQTAIEAMWVPGVCIALEAGADVTVQANDGMTPIHSAASLGNLDVLNEILSVAKQKDSIDIKTKEGETALFLAIKNGHLDCVKAILNEGASIKITLPGNVSVFHVAAEHGHLEVLQVLCEYDAEATKLMINQLTTRDKRGFGPIHFAVMNNHARCVEYLLNSSADIRLRSTDSPHKSITPLHLAAIKNHLDVAKLILEVDNTTIHEVNSMGWFPLHSAGHHGSRDVITLLLKEGADLSGYTDGVPKYRRTAIDMILNNITKPTDFLEEVFDSYITMNSTSIQDPNCEIEVDYRILMPSVCEMQQMKVVEALLKTGNRHGQKKLLVHPLTESYLHLKWKALLPFFYAIMALYTLFSLSLTVFIVSVFFYRDTKETTPSWLNAHVWAYFIYITILLIVLQEILYMNVKSNRHLLQLETWVKFGSIALASILPPAIIVVSLSESEWPRHVATVALLLSWLEMMFLLSRLPNWGYYVLMFGKVASNVVKILLTFAFLVIGFSLSFMIQFRSQVPFEGPWSAIVKTMVMMTSEFDYGSMFDQEHITELSTSILVVRIIFVIFLILAAIVLMNLLVGVAVSDINDLEILGNIRRLAKQAEFLGTLDILVYNKVFKVLLPKKVNNSIKNKRKVSATICLRPGMPRWKNYKALPSRIRDAIFDKAQKQKTQQENDIGFQIFQNKIDEIHQALTKTHEKKSEMIDLPKNEDKPTKLRMRHDEILSRMNNLDGEITEIREQINLLVQAPSPVEELNSKMDKMSFEMEAIKQTLFRLESKLSE